MENLENNLSLEQKLNHRLFSDRVKQLSREEAQELLIQMNHQMMIKENLYRELFIDQQKDIVDSLFGVTVTPP
ncbi:MAG: NblA/ycf18 family protein [Cyanobacteria bacterium P01_A01_bin.83]